MALLRTRSYLTLLVLAAVIGAPVSAIAYFYLKFVRGGPAVRVPDPAEGLDDLGPGMVADPAARPGWPHRRTHTPLPARDRRPQAG